MVQARIIQYFSSGGGYPQIKRRSPEADEPVGLKSHLLSLSAAREVNSHLRLRGRIPILPLKNPPSGKITHLSLTKPYPLPQHTQKPVVQARTIQYFSSGGGYPQIKRRSPEGDEPLGVTPAARKVRQT